MAAAEGAGCVVISAAIEEEIAQLDDAERAEFLGAMGLEEAGLDRLIREGYRLLGLATYFTAGPKEARAWTIPAGTPAPQAAGVIHGDFERGFIRAETIAYDDYVALGGEQGAQGSGQDALGGQDLPGGGRRRAALPVQHLKSLPGVRRAAVPQWDRDQAAVGKRKRRRRAPPDASRRQFPRVALRRTTTVRLRCSLELFSARSDFVRIRRCIDGK